MTDRDPRCNCDEPDCLICSAPTHRPWTPRPGASSAQAVEADILRTMKQEEYERQMRRWNLWQSVRRYLLVLLLVALGSMVGSAITILTFLHYD